MCEMGFMQQIFVRIRDVVVFRANCSVRLMFSCSTNYDIRATAATGILNDCLLDLRRWSCLESATDDDAQMKHAPIPSEVAVPGWHLCCFE